MAREQKRSGKQDRKTDAERRKTHKKKYGTTKLPERKYKNRKKLKKE